MLAMWAQPTGLRAAPSMRLAMLRVILPGEMPRAFLHVSDTSPFPACFAPPSSLLMHAEAIFARQKRGVMED